MNLAFTERASDSPWVNLIWQTQAVEPMLFYAPAQCHWELVVTRLAHKSYLSIVGPQTRLTPAPITKESTYLGIQFKLGVFFPDISPATIVNSGIDLPNARSNRAWLNGLTWEFPTFENADTFVEQLINHGVLMFDETVAQALRNEPIYLSPRSVQRAFKRATGLSQRKITQIERARQAAKLLQNGLSIDDTIATAGFADQPHLTRTLTQLMGQTPAQILKLSQLA